MERRHAVVVGGGLAGLTAGYTLRQAGWQVTLVESSAYVGGRVRTVRQEGYTLDTGATQMSSGYHEYLALAEELGLRPAIVESSAHVGFIRGGRLFLLDSRHLLGAAFSSLLSLRGKLAVLKTGWDFFRLRPAIDTRNVSLSHAADVESAADYAMRRVGLEVFDTLVDPLVRAYVLNRAARVSVLEWFSALRVLGGQTMLSMSGGNDRMPLALAQGLDVRLSCAATAIRRDGTAVLVDVMDQGVARTIAAQACILATRLPEALALYPPLQRIAGPLALIARYNRGIVVHVGFKIRPQCPAVGLLLGAAEHEDIALIWLEHNKNPDRAPSGHALFGVYFDEAVGDRCYALADAALVAIGTEFIERLFPELHGAAHVSHVTRWPLGILNPAPGVYREVHAMLSRLDPTDAVQLAGDYFTCTGQNSAVYYGQLAAERVLAQTPLAESCSGAP